MTPKGVGGSWDGIELKMEMMIGEMTIPNERMALLENLVQGKMNYKRNKIIVNDTWYLSLKVKKLPIYREGED